MKASIDIGSNSVLLLILDELGHELAFESRVTSLGKNLDKTGTFQDSSMNDTIDVFKEYQEICHKFHLKMSDVIITATEASRVSKNAEAFFKKLHDLFDVKIEIISGEREAYLASLGVIRGEKLEQEEKEILVMDIGGGSTELIKLKASPFEIIESISLPLGSVRMTEWLESGVWDQKRSELLESFNIESYKAKKIIGVAGTMTSIMNVFFEEKNFTQIPLSKSKMNFSELKEKMESLKDKTPQELNNLYPFLGKRSQVLWGGYKVCEFFVNELGVEEIFVSCKGLVHGSIYSSLDKHRSSSSL